MSNELKVRETMELNLPVFQATEHALVSCENKKGERKQVTVEGSYWLKGAEKLSVLDDTATSALRQANGGRYRAAFEIFAAEFKPIEKYMKDGGDAVGWKDAKTFAKAVAYMLNRAPKPGTEFKGSKAIAVALAKAISNIPTFVHCKPEPAVVDVTAEVKAE